MPSLRSVGACVWPWCRSGSSLYLYCVLGRSFLYAMRTSEPTNRFSGVAFFVWPHPCFAPLGRYGDPCFVYSPSDLATKPAPPSPSPPRPLLVTEESGPARAHEKARREQRWLGSRARAHTDGRARNQLTPYRHKSEEGKAESIATGHARRRELKEAEQARIDELIEMQKKINLGREIGGH